jgi:hypothetical protein
MYLLPTVERNAVTEVLQFSQCELRRPSLRGLRSSGSSTVFVGTRHRKTHDPNQHQYQHCDFIGLNAVKITKRLPILFHELFCRLSGRAMAKAMSWFSSLGYE